MSIFIKAGFWIEKQTGYKGEFNLTRFVTNLIAANPSPTLSNIIETDGVFRGSSIINNYTYGIPETLSTGLISITPINLNSYQLDNSKFIDRNQVSFIKINEEQVFDLYLNVQNNGGYTVDCNDLIYLYGGLFLNDSSINSVSCPVLVRLNELFMYGNSSLTLINFPSLITFNEINIESANELTSINFSLVTNALSLNLSQNPLLASIDLPLLTNATRINIYDNPSLASIDLSSLTTIENEISINNNISLTSIDLPSLVSAFIISINNFQSTTIDLPSLTTVDELYLTNNENLTIIDLSSLTTANLFLEITDNALLETIDLPSLTSVGSLNFSNCALTEATVDNVLAKLVSIPTFTGSDYSVDLSGGTTSPPSATGLLDVAILEGRGCFVIVNT